MGSCSAQKVKAVERVCCQVTLASGVGNVPAQTESVTVPQPFQGEESVGENTFGSTAANDAGEGVTSPGGQSPSSLFPR